MPGGGFFGGFAEGFSQSVGRAQEQRRLRDVLQFQREQQAVQDRRADRQLKIQERGLELREQEALDLRSYRQQTAERQQQLLEIQKRSAAIQQEMQLRQMDQAALGSMEKVFSPAVPAPLRSLILKQNAPYLGIDPKSQQFKDFADSIVKLDSDSLTALKTSIQLIAPTAQPGEIVNLAKGVMSGQMTIDQVMDLVKGRAIALREEQERLLLDRELGGGAASVSPQGPMPADPPSPTSRTQGGGAIASTSVDLSGRQPTSASAETQVELSGAGQPSGGTFEIPGFDALPPAKQVAVQRDMKRSGADDPIEEMTPAKLRKSAIVFLKHGMKEAASFSRLLAQDLEEAGEGTFLQVDPKTGQVIFSQGGKGGMAKPLTEQQSKDLVFATRAKGALKNLDPIDEELTSFTGHLAELDPTGIARSKGQSPDFQKALQAGLEFLQAILRKDTGAAITPQEEKEYGLVYLPRPGDGPDVIAQKRASRRRAIIALEAGMSPEQILRLLPTPKTQAEFDKLPSGALYVDPDDGKTYRKP
ncbi:hypothetical protein I6F15_04465 [Bradyrhizobium sp. BRP14]|nr:hypothetical protein [Bradyrhizobium sp. BRP14]